MADHHYTSGDDIIQATTALGFSWNDNIYGDGGNDTAYLGDGVVFVSGPGNDTLWGSGTSQYATWFAQQPVVINLAEGWAQDGFGGLDQLHGIGTIHLTGLGGEVIGSAADETVFVFGGDVTIDMGAGNDTVLMWQLDSHDFTIRQTGDVVTLKGKGHTMQLRGVESIQFQDATINPVYATTHAMVPVGDLTTFTETEHSQGWWYAGVYNPPQLVSASPQAPLAIDIDGDGDMDAIVPMMRGYRTGVDTRMSFQVFQNVDGHLAYSPELSALSPFVSGSRRSAEFHLVRDDTDVLVTIAHDTAVETETRYDIPWRYGDITMTSMDPFRVVTGELVTNTLTFAAQKSGRSTAVDAHSMAIGDINGDGMDDVLVGDFRGVFALLQTASGPFQRIATPLMAKLNGWLDPGLPGATPGLLIDMGMGDVNGDGLDDLVVGWGHATVRSRVFFNDAHAGFTANNSAALPESVYGAANSLHLKTWVEDFDGDGDNDVMILQSRYEPYYGGNYLQLLINDGLGHFTDETAARLGNPANNPDTFGGRLQWTDYWQAADVNNDGALDVLGRHPVSGTPFYYLNDGHGHFTLVEVSLPGNEANLAWGDFDGDGNIESLAFTSTWTDSVGTSSLNTFSVYELATLAPPQASRAYDIGGNAGTVAKILGAVFGPEAVHNQAYAGIGLGLMDAGTTYDALLDLALDAALGSARSNTTVVTMLYTNLFGYAPAADAAAYFVNLLDTGQLSQVALARKAADLDVNLANIDLVGLAQQGLDYIAS